MRNYYSKTFRVPLKDGALQKVPCNFVVVDLPHWGERKFAVHPDVNGDDGELYLSDHASGRIVGCLTPIKKSGYDDGIQIKDQEAATYLINKLIDAHGLGRITGELTDATVVNK